jgi:hypothetical protein
VAYFKNHWKAREGKAISASGLAEIAKTCDWITKLRVAAPLTLSNIAGGPLIGLGPITQALACQPSSNVAGAAGTWPEITAVSFTADVYAMAGSVMVKIAPGATIRNWLAAPLEANKTCWLLQDSSGNFVVISQSCV